MKQSIHFAGFTKLIVNSMTHLNKINLFSFCLNLSAHAKGSNIKRQKTSMAKISSERKGTYLGSGVEREETVAIDLALLLEVLREGDVPFSQSLIHGGFCNGGREKKKIF